MQCIVKFLTQAHDQWRTNNKIEFISILIQNNLLKRYLYPSNIENGQAEAGVTNVSKYYIYVYSYSWSLAESIEPCPSEHTGLSLMLEIPNLAKRFLF